ncbi:hypothetical protein BABA_14407 [Neobacillus bataviensis LMG 21833]|uniref:DUF4176 domain-containing protein n=1 Tax=Neobacillus bataviensis LMG 21833 TaxID=1117379 RepID=K6D2E7_9BACI|nr:DUF4176 domain-containing protein [Neobacillus bataviensis]EKN66657.1 hypothetical protein BABA_14407 [Neobacillus bataviensis LMG 21833]
MDKYLPIGSVVLLEGGTKRVMIYGRRQQELNTKKIWDYIACLYPEGNINEQYMYLFNHDQIEKIYFIGYQDEEEFEFLKENLAEKPV